MDLDLAVAGEPERGRAAIAQAVDGPAFQLSERFGAWRVHARDDRFTFDVSPLQGATIEEDLAQPRLQRQRDRGAAAAAASRSTRSGGIPDLERRRRCA